MASAPGANFEGVPKVVPHPHGGSKSSFTALLLQKQQLEHRRIFTSAQSMWQQQLLPPPSLSGIVLGKTPATPRFMELHFLRHCPKFHLSLMFIGIWGI